MFGIGSTELLLIIAIAVIIIGPRQLPQVARTMGKMFAQLKRASNDLRTAVNEKVYEAEEFEDLREAKDSLEKEARQLESQSRDFLDTEFEAERKISGELGEVLNAAKGEPTPGPKASKKSAAPKKRTVTAKKKAAGAKPAAARKAAAASGKTAAATGGKSKTGKARSA